MMTQQLADMIYNMCWQFDRAKEHIDELETDLKALLKEALEGESDDD